MGDAYRPDSPLPPEQSGIADYAESFRSAREAADVNVTLPFRGQQLAMARDMIEHQMGQVEWLSYCPQLPLTATVHDPERLIWKPPHMSAWMSHLLRQLYQAVVLLLDPALARERRLASRLSKLVTLTSMGAHCPQQRMRLTEERVVSIPYPQGDCQALAKELAYLLDNPECIEQRSRSATRLGAGSSWSKVAAQFHEMFRQLLEKRAA